jgi:tRNA-Thr(GGU) m(6)t(6)A37 methyltransferase TsaA
MTVVRRPLVAIGDPGRPNPVGPLSLRQDQRAARGRGDEIVGQSATGPSLKGGGRRSSRTHSSGECGGISTTVWSLAPRVRQGGGDASLRADRVCAAAGRRRRSAVRDAAYRFDPIGWVESPLLDRDEAPRQGDEGSPLAWLVFEPRVTAGLQDLRTGEDLLVLTWLERARRDVLTTHPRSEPSRPVRGVFSTRSPDRPNPIGLHRVRIEAIDGLRLRVSNLEALNGTPILDVKPVLGPVEGR